MRAALAAPLAAAAAGSPTRAQSAPEPAPALTHARRQGWEALAALALEPIRAELAAAATGRTPFLLLRSWVTRAGRAATDFDRVNATAAFVYDNALAGLALLHAGETDAAARIGGALALCQEQDRFWHDGRLRNAYRAGPVFADAPASAALPGWWDAAAGAWREDGYHAGTSTGVMAWAMLLWLGLAEAGRGPRCRDAALRAGAWIERTCADAAGPGGYRGGTIGHEPAPAALTWKSTEHNIDLMAAFARLATLTGDPAWRARAAHAARFVAAMWRPAEARFLVGTLPDGATPNAGARALDVQLWAPLAAPQETGWRPALDRALATHGLPAGAPRAELAGVDFDADRDGVWMEGTAQAMLALRLRGRADDAALAARFAATLLDHRAEGNRFLATDVASLSTGLATGLVPGAADFRYPRRPHLAVNAWVALAALGANPFAPLPRALRGGAP